MRANTLVVVSLATLAACAGNTYRAEAGVMFARARGEVALQNASGNLVLGNNQHSLGTMGLDDTEASPFLRVQTAQDKHRWRAQGFVLDSEGSGTLGSDYGNLIAGTPVTTSIDFVSVAGSYAYELFRNEHLRFAAGGQLGYYKLDVAARSGPNREEVSTDVLVPMPYVELESYVGDFTFSANAGVMAADLGDASGRYWDIEVAGRWQLLPELDLLAGYRYVLVDAYGRATSRDFDSDVEIQGWFFGGAIRF